MKLSPNAPCPCGSERKIKKCCGRFHRGKPALPRELMRARYSAYALGDVDFLIETTHPGGPLWRRDRATWAAEVSEYCRATRFLGLTILDDSLDEAGGRGFVTFQADLERDGQSGGFVERSLFLREAGRWLYHSGEVR